MTSADRIKSGEVYKVVVDNLRQNLEVIKNYEEVKTLLLPILPICFKSGVISSLQKRYGSLKPSNLYLSMINAALSGPHRISLSEAEYTLGKNSKKIFPS